MKMRFLWPLTLFALLAGLLGIGLTLDPKKVDSPLINKNAPAFDLGQLNDSTLHISPDNLKGQVWMLHVWASWCSVCLGEHPLINRLSTMQGLTLVGLNYKDDRLAALSWLNKLGNPYQAVAFDPEGKAGLDWGVYGVPESYLIDKHGVIRYKEVGPINDTVLKETLLPLIAQLQAETL